MRASSGTVRSFTQSILTRCSLLIFRHVRPGCSRCRLLVFRWSWDGAAWTWHCGSKLPEQAGNYGDWLSLHCPRLIAVIGHRHRRSERRGVSSCVQVVAHFARDRSIPQFSLARATSTDSLLDPMDNFVSERSNEVITDWRMVCADISMGCGIGNTLGWLGDIWRSATKQL